MLTLAALIALPPSGVRRYASIARLSTLVSVDRPGDTPRDLPSTPPSAPASSSSDSEVEDDDNGERFDSYPPAVAAHPLMAPSALASVATDISMPVSLHIKPETRPPRS